MIQTLQASVHDQFLPGTGRGKAVAICEVGEVLVLVAKAAFQWGRQARQRIAVAGVAQLSARARALEPSIHGPRWRFLSTCVPRPVPNTRGMSTEAACRNGSWLFAGEGRGGNFGRGGERQVGIDKRLSQTRSLSVSGGGRGCGSFVRASASLRFETSMSSWLRASAKPSTSKLVQTLEVAFNVQFDLACSRRLCSLGLDRQLQHQSIFGGGEEAVG